MNKGTLHGLLMKSRIQECHEEYMATCSYYEPVLDTYELVRQVLMVPSKVQAKRVEETKTEKEAPFVPLTMREKRYLKK